MDEFSWNLRVVKSVKKRLWKDAKKPVTDGDWSPAGPEGPQNPL